MLFLENKKTFLAQAKIGFRLFSIIRAHVPNVTYHLKRYKNYKRYYIFKRNIKIGTWEIFNYN